jgi:ATP-binding cassette subfamily B protein
MWPKDRLDLKQRVLVALGVLIGAKIITVLVPYTYKWATKRADRQPPRAAAGCPPSSAWP